MRYKDRVLINLISSEGMYIEIIAFHYDKEYHLKKKKEYDTTRINHLCSANIMKGCFTRWC